MNIHVLWCSSYHHVFQSSYTGICYRPFKQFVLSYLIHIYYFHLCVTFLQ